VGEVAEGRNVSDYEYELPRSLIAQYPTRERGASRLLVVPRKGDFAHRRFADLADLLAPGDALVVNESRVLPARFLGRKSTGARAEVLLLRPRADGGDGAAQGPGAWSEDVRRWEALVRPGGKLKAGSRVVVAEDLEIEVLDVLPGGSRVVELHTSGSVQDALDLHGHMPLPPYIERSDERLDRDRYQTVYARTPGSVAAPTAGLHLTEGLLAALEDRGVTRVGVTLHVGVGTFRPVEGDDPARHRMHAEWYSVSEEAAAAVNGVRADGGRGWAVGTTAVRTLEAAADGAGLVRAGVGETDLFIRPPYVFRAVDALITNFHLPRSTLLMLVASLAGYERTMQAYSEAIREGYRFYSYGDAMVILPED
jgi:S-adenosylmethionine:tRNA ribosyltransferase-isomerase